MATLRLFGPAREAAGVARLPVAGRDVAEVLDAARARFGPDFVQVLAVSRIWVNGEQAEGASPVTEGDEVAVLPPVSGG